MREAGRQLQAKVLGVSSNPPELGGGMEHSPKAPKRNDPAHNLISDF